MEKSKRSFLPWGMVSTILTLAWPTMLEELMQTAVQYIDTAMVGAIGTQATAAVGATSTVNWLIGSTVAAIGVGFLSFVSQACGAGDTKRAGKASSQAVLAVLVCGTFFTALMLALSSKVPVWMQVDRPFRTWLPNTFSFCTPPCWPGRPLRFSVRCFVRQGMPKRPCGSVFW